MVTGMLTRAPRPSSGQVTVRARPVLILDIGTQNTSNRIGRLSAPYLIARPRVTRIQLEIAFEVEVPRNFQRFELSEWVGEFRIGRHLKSAQWE